MPGRQERGWSWSREPLPPLRVSVVRRGQNVDSHGGELSHLTKALWMALLLFYNGSSLNYFFLFGRSHISQVCSGHAIKHNGLVCSLHPLTPLHWELESSRSQYLPRNPKESTLFRNSSTRTLPHKCQSP